MKIEKDIELDPSILNTECVSGRVRYHTDTRLFWDSFNNCFSVNLLVREFDRDSFRSFLSNLSILPWYEVDWELWIQEGKVCLTVVGVDQKFVTESDLETLVRMESE